MSKDTRSEKSVEDYLVAQCKKRQWHAIKLRGYGGIPDRLVIADGRVAFVELKRPRGGLHSQTQKFWQKMLTRLNHMHSSPSTREAVDVLMAELEVLCQPE